MFDLIPEKHNFTATVPLESTLRFREKIKKKTQKLKMTATQIPVTPNNATTGHKLQGASLKQIFIHALSNVRNWLCVTLSRVKTRIGGLYLHMPLDEKLLDDFNSIPENLTNMINYFTQKCLQKAF